MEKYRLIEEIRHGFKRDLMYKHTTYFDSRDEAQEFMVKEIERGYKNTHILWSFYPWDNAFKKYKEDGKSSIDNWFFLGYNSGYYKNADLNHVNYRIEKVNEAEDKKKLEEVNKECGSSGLLAVVCFIIGIILVCTANSRCEFGCTPASFIASCIPFVFGGIFLCLSSKKTQDDVDNGNV